MLKNLVGLITVVFLSGCSINAVQYSPDFKIVEELSNTDSKQISVNEVTSQNTKRISLRGINTLTSPNGSFEAYLQKALIEQFIQADIYSDSSHLTIDSTILENDISIASMSEGTGIISAKFTVTNTDNDTVLFSENITAKHKFSSNFIASIAIGHAQRNYPILVQKLIYNLMSDSNFISALSNL